MLVRASYDHLMYSTSYITIVDDELVTYGKKEKMLTRQQTCIIFLKY